MALLSIIGNESEKAVSSASLSSPDSIFIFLILLSGIILVCGLVYLIIKVGDLIEAKKKYYLKLVSEKNK